MDEFFLFTSTKQPSVTATVWRSRTKGSVCENAAVHLWVMGGFADGLWLRRR